MSDAVEITRNAKSNLAFALHILPKAKRQDMVVFYAYCRTIDDLADDDSASLTQRTDALAMWKDGLTHGFSHPTPFQQELSNFRNRYDISNELLTAIIDGCMMDLEKTRYETWGELSDYIWKVASSVGLVSIQIFGCKTPESKTYAESLGKALQLTNIMRDVGEDLSQRNRIYLPLQDLRQFDYSEQDLVDRVQDERYQELMEFQAVRARNWFNEAAINLTATDHAALKPARIMSSIYRNLLDQMQDDKFRVFDQRYRVSHMRKLLIFTRHFFT